MEAKLIDYNSQWDNCKCNGFVARSIFNLCYSFLKEITNVNSLVNIMTSVVIYKFLQQIMRQDLTLVNANFF